VVILSGLVSDGRFHVGGPGFPRVARLQTTVRSLAAAAELAQAPAKLSPKDAVDDEVDGRVGGHDDIAEVVVVVVRQTARVLDADHVDELIDKRRRLTDEKDDDDNDHNLHNRKVSK